MGKLIAFWSPFHGQAKTTASMAAVAMALSNVTGDSVAMFHTQSGMADLEGMFDNRMDNEKRVQLYEGAGLNSLLLEFKRTELTNEIVVRSALPVAGIDNLVFLPGLEMDETLAKMDDVREIMHTLAVRDIPKAFDWTLVDLSSGNNSLSKSIMDKADVLVITLSQNVATWDIIFEEHEELAEKANTFFLFGGHKKESSYGVRNFRRMKHVNKKNSGVIPDSVGYMDDISRGTVASFYLKNEKAGKNDENGTFIQECKDAALKIRALAYGEVKGEVEE